jgi:hypothetical protein
LLAIKNLAQEGQKLRTRFQATKSQSNREKIETKIKELKKKILKETDNYC